MIPIPEIHDTTGNWERLSDAVDFWLREETVQMISNVPDSNARDFYL